MVFTQKKNHSLGVTKQLSNNLDGQFGFLVANFFCSLLREKIAKQDFFQK